MGPAKQLPEEEKMRSQLIRLPNLRKLTAYRAYMERLVRRILLLYK